MKTNLELRAKLVAKYGEEEVRKVENDDFYMGVIPFEEYVNLETTDTEALKAKCLNTLRIMKEKTSGWHGNNYERLYNLCEKDELSESDMKTIVVNHKA